MSALVCGGCTACCANDLIILHPEHGDDPAQYVTARVRHPFTGAPAWAIRPRDDGGPGCRYLSRDLDAPGCTIYTRRPAVCREFDCRRLFASMPRAARRRAVRNGHATTDVFEAGRARLDTLEKEPRT